jgi:predicted nucleic acid-binding protein
MVIDTGIFIEHLRAKDKLNTSLYLIPDNTEIFISAVSLYELLMGATTMAKENDVQAITENIPVLPFSDEVAIKAAQLYHLLKSQNKLIEFRDIFIAATCIVNELPLMTSNKKLFNRIEGLKLA